MPVVCIRFESTPETFIKALMIEGIRIFIYLNPKRMNELSIHKIHLIKVLLDYLTQASEMIGNPFWQFFHLLYSHYSSFHLDAFQFSFQF